MEWTKNKPAESGWYQYAGDLCPLTKESAPLHCDPTCRVAVHSDDENPFIAVYESPELYDYETADGLWSNFEEPLEEPDPGELPQDG